MGEFGKLLLDSVKWLTSLRTAAQQLVAALFMLVGILMGTVYFLYKQNIKDREAAQIREAKIREEARQDLAQERMKTDLALKAVNDCNEQKYTLVNNLFLEQRAINQEAKPLASTRRQFANTNKAYISSTKKDVKQIVEKLVEIQQKQ